MRSEIPTFVVVGAVLAFPLIGLGQVLPSLSMDDLEEEPKPVAAAPVAAPTAEAEASVVESPVSEVTDAAAPEPVTVDTDAPQELGVTYLRRLAESDEEGLIDPPTRHRKVVDRKEVEVRYTRKLVDVPVYEYEEVWRDVKVGDSVDAVKVRKKVKIKKKVGTEKRERLVRDKDGDIVRMERRPIYGPGGPDEWSFGQFGRNAMAIYALMQAGVEPDDPIVQDTADRLLRIYQCYGIPDTTWDLAWSVAAFSMIDRDLFQKMAEEMAGKLLDGQIEDGPATGLWGPVCVNTKLLAAMAKKKAEYSKYYLAFKERYADRKRDSDREKMEQALSALQAFAELASRVTMLRDEGSISTRFVVLKDEMGVEQPIYVARYPTYLYNQRSADIESTAIAMFGIRVAAKAGLLPKETWRPLDDRKRPLSPPRDPATVLNRLRTAITRQQRAAGWSELNIHQPVTDFDQVPGIEGVPADQSSFKDLASPVTATSTAQGYSVFAGMASMYGLNSLRSIARNVVAGNNAVKAVLDEGVASADGGIVPPYEFCFFASDMPDLGKPEYDANAWELISAFLVSEQSKDGAWRVERKQGSHYMVPTSYLARQDVYPGVYMSTRVSEEIPSSAFVPFDKTRGNTHHEWARLYRCKRDIVSTSYALLALSAGDDDAGQ